MSVNVKLHNKHVARKLYLRPPEHVAGTFARMRSADVCMHAITKHGVLGKLRA